MDNLTLEQLAPYLPYGLTCIIPLYQEKGVLNVEQISKNRVWVSKGGSVHLWQDQYISNIKPILRPLSDLTKEIEHNGERFVPIHRILEAYCFDVSKMSEYEILSYVESLIEIDISYMTVKILCELHFDFLGLIAAGLAVDMNTLEGGKR